MKISWAGVKTHAVLKRSNEVYLDMYITVTNLDYVLQGTRPVGDKETSPFQTFFAACSTPF